MPIHADTLHWVLPPDEVRSPSTVGREILALYRQDFSLTTWALCKLLRCERRWVQDDLRPELHHIRVSHYFRQFIVEEFSLTEQEADDFNYSSYFYSVKSLESYWASHAVATQKTRLIDLADYLDPAAHLSSISEELNRYRHTKRSKAEKDLHIERMRELLTGEGYLYYLASKFRKSDWKAAALPMLPLQEGSTPLCTKADIRKRNGLKSDTAALQWLVNHGAVRIQLGGKTLWSVVPHLFRLPLAVPVDYFPLG